MRAALGGQRLRLRRPLAVRAVGVEREGLEAQRVGGGVLLQQSDDRFALLGGGDGEGVGAVALDARQIEKPPCPPL